MSTNQKPTIDFSNRSSVQYLSSSRQTPHRAVLTVLIGLVAITANALTWTRPSPTQKSIHNKKLIEWGWDEPDTKILRENIDQMEHYPFDGLVFHAKTNRWENLAWEVWSDKKFTRENFDRAIDDLKATKFQRFTERFLRVNATPAKTDWFDDEAWACVANNFGVAAQLAKEGRCQGFMFDTEQYDGTVFDYRQQPSRGQRTFVEYQAKVRQRGREWIKAVNRHYADITILITFSYEMSYRHAEKPNDRSTAPYGLLADFIDGILEGCSRQTTLVDAWEFSYPYKERFQFEQAYDKITVHSLEWTKAPRKYKTQLKAGFGVWMDHTRNPWDVTDFSKNYFSPAQFESSVRSALHVSDHYVWVYTERPRWWTNELLPVEYVQALTKARNPKQSE